MKAPLPTGCAQVLLCFVRESEHALISSLIRKLKTLEDGKNKTKFMQFLSTQFGNFTYLLEKQNKLCSQIIVRWIDVHYNNSECCSVQYFCEFQTTVFSNFIIELLLCQK